MMNIKHKSVLEKIDAIKPYMVFIMGAILYGCVRAFLAETYVLDDTEYLRNFENNYAEMGNSMMKALLAVLFNADVLAYTGDFRTYGISRFFHACIMLLFGNSCRVYAFLIGFIHVMSGYLVYKILVFLLKNNDAIFFATLVYVFSPFAKVQSFHHFTYLMLPLYILLGYIYWELKQKNGTKKETYAKGLIISMCWIILIVFTGEHTLPMLFCVLTLFCIDELAKERRVEIVRYVVLMVWEVFLFVGWYVFYNAFINKAKTTRFAFGKIAIKEGIKDYFLSASNALKSFLQIPMEFTATVRTHIGRIEIGKNSIICAICLVIIFAIIVIGIRKMTRNNTVIQDEQVKGLLPLIIFAISSGVVYVALEIFTQCYSMPSRYFYVTLTLLLVLLVVIAFRLLGREKAKLLAVPIVLICVLENVFWCSVILYETKETDKEIVSFFDEAEKRGYKDVVIFNSGYAWKQALTNSNTYAGDSAFDWAVTLNGWVGDNYNFDRIVFAKYDDLICEEIDENIISVFDEKTQKYILLDKEKVCFAGISGISKMWGKYGEERRNYYYGYEEFSKSADCYGVKYYSASADANVNYDVVRKEELIYIDVGNETKQSTGGVLDRPYGEVATNGICYGYLGKGLVTNVIPYELYEGTGELGETFLTNRYTGGTMEYRFSNLPQEKELAIVIDGYEWWQYEANKRIYDIEIKTNDKTYSLESIDTYCLGYVENSKTHKSVYRLMINLPHVDEVTIIFKNREGFDVATLNGIGIVER